MLTVRAATWQTDRGYAASVISDSGLAALAEGLPVIDRDKGGFASVGQARAWIEQELAAYEARVGRVRRRVWVDGIEQPQGEEVA